MIVVIFVSAIILLSYLFVLYVEHNFRVIEEMTDVAVTMTMILGSILAGIAGLVTLQTPSKDGGTFLPLEPSKRSYELFVMAYTPIWIFLFGCIVVFGWYESFDAWSYIFVCLGLALPLLLQPIVLPSAGSNSPDALRPLLQRYSFKANVWIAMYSFIGNYWYTHCEYFDVAHGDISPLCGGAVHRCLTAMVANVAHQTFTRY